MFTMIFSTFPAPETPVAPSNRGRFAHGPPPQPPAPRAPRGHGLRAQRRAQRGAERGGGLRPRGRRGGRDVETWRPVGLGNSRKNGGFMRFSWGKSWDLMENHGENHGKFTEKHGGLNGFD